MKNLFICLLTLMCFGVVEAQSDSIFMNETFKEFSNKSFSEERADRLLDRLFEANRIVSSPNISLDDDPEAEPYIDSVLVEFWAKHFRISGVFSGSRDRLQITREEYTLTLFFGSRDTLSDIEFILHQGNGNSETRLYEIYMKNNMFFIKLRDCYRQTRLVEYDNDFMHEDALISRCAPHVYYKQNVSQEIEKRYIFRQ